MSATTTITTEQTSASGDWWERAACRGLDTSLFFPQRGESTAKAEAVCAGCPVRDDCLWFALGDGTPRSSERFGIWGGSSERQRRRLRLDRRHSEAVAGEVRS
ncbi:MAG: WhiB family transcriptional regulator [Actinomycetota bacterium]